MKTIFRVVFFLVLALGLCFSAFAAESTVYVDGVGADANCYATLADAVEAVADGGTVVLTADYATPTGSATHLPAKSFTLTSQNDAVLTLGRTFFIYGDVVFDNITVKNGASSGVDFIYCNGYNFTVTSSVTTIAKGSRYTTIFSGTSDPSKYPIVPTKSEVKLYGGDWHIVSAANYKGTFTNTVDVLVDGAAVHSSFYIGNYSGTSAGTCNLTVKSGSLTTVKGTAGAYGITLNGGSVESLEVDATVSPEVGKTVTISAATGKITTMAPEGYKVVQDGTVYSTTKSEAITNLDVAFVSESGTGDGTSAASPTSDIASAYALLGEDGGTVVFVGEYTTSATVEFPTHTAPVKLTSVYGGIDYRTTADSAIRYKGTGFIKFNGPTEIDGLTVKLDKSSAGFCANLYPLTVGYDFAAVNTDGTSAYRMYLIGGQNGEEKNGALASGKTNEIKVFSGKFAVVSAFSRNIALSHSGTVTVTVGGTADINSLYFGAMGTGAKGGTGIVYLNENVNVNTAYLSGNTVGMNGSAILHMEDNAAVGAFKNSSATYFANGTRELYYTSTVTLPSDYASHFDTVTQTDAPVEAPSTVYLDGTGKTEGAYTSLSAALSDMPGGGTVVVAGNTTISSETVLPGTAAVTITSVYDGKDYTDTASLKISANLTLGGDTTFENVVLERVKNTDGNYYIAAAGNKLVIEESVICLNYTGYQWLSVVGGTLSGTHNGGSHIVVKAGHFRNLFGGNYKGDFYGDSVVEISGGMFENSVCGGSYIGNFTGNAYVTFGGEASMLYVSSAPAGLVGGTLGSGGSNSYTFTGDTHLTILGGASVTTNVIGASRGKDVTHIGDTYVTVDGNSFVYYSVYAGGYASPLDGNTHTVINGGLVWGNLFGGSYSSTVSGNSTVEINGGKLCYYKTNDASSWPEPAGTRNVYGGGSTGSTLSGTATVTVSGGSIYGDVNGIGGEEATVVGKTTITVKGGEIVGKIGTADTTVIDLSNGSSLSLGVSSTVDTLIGGGNLLIGANNLLKVGTLSGKTALSINGLPLPKTYVSVTTVLDGAEINYAAQDTETLTKSGNDYLVDFDGSFKQTVVTIHFKEGCEIRTRAGKVDAGGWLTPDSSTDTSATYTLTPGLHNSVLIYTSSNYQRKFFYVDGRSERMDVYVEFDAKQGIGYEARFAGLHTDQVLEEFYDTSNIEGFKTPDSPYFKNHPTGSIRFTTHEETVAFLAEKQAGCDYMYTFYPAKTTVRGFDFPVVIFTKDEIPEGATIEEIGRIVSATKGREIVMISGGVHGCEPSGAEGALAYISELCGEYGEEVFASGYLGAVIVLPNINPEGLYIYSRGTDADVANTNINRDYMALSDIASQTYTSVYQQFWPTITVDLHESLATPVWSDGDIMTDIYDAGLSYYGNISGPHAKTMDILYGDLSAASDNIGEKLCADALHGVEEKGMRIWFYEKNVAPNFSRNYCSNLGSFAYTTEIPGTEADANYARRVFTQVAVVKELVGLVIESEGAVAGAVAKAREELGFSAQIFNARRPIVIDQATARLPGYGIYWNNPLPGPDATIRYADNPQWTDVYNVAARYRTMATAYVVSADLANIDAMLALLDRHGIEYVSLEVGITLTLSQYSGTETRAIVGAEQAYTFANGAYLIPVDGYRAILTAFLFEPDNTDITEGVGTLVQCGYLTVSDIYRSTESYIGAKYGAMGTYVELPTEGKSVANAVVDGVVYEDIGTEGANAYVVRAEDEIVLNFTDGTSETYYYSDITGDINGDRTVTVADALMLIRAIVNHESTENGDANGDGKVSLADVIRVMKLMTK